jgi:hypothetical protein
VLKKIGKASAFAGIAAALAFANPTSAGAYVGRGFYNGDGISLRSGPHVSGTTIYGYGYNGQWNCVTKQTTGDYIQNTNTWDWNKDLSTGVSGWSAHYYIVYWFTAC